MSKTEFTLVGEGPYAQKPETAPGVNCPVDARRVNLTETSRSDFLSDSGYDFNAATRTKTKEEERIQVP